MIMKKRKTHALEHRKLGRPLTEKEREAVKKVLSLPKEKRDFVFTTMQNLFVKLGICSKDGKLINRMKLIAFRQTLAERKEIMAKKFNKKRAQKSLAKFFINAGICSKEGKLINKKKYNEFQQMMAEERKKRILAEKASKKLK